MSAVKCEQLSYEDLSCEAVLAWLQAEVLAVPPGHYSPQLLGFAQQLVNLSQEWVRRLARAGEGSGRWAEDGYPSATAWVLCHTGQSRGQARRVLQQARHLEHMTHSSAAAAAGALNESQIQPLTACRAKTQAHYNDQIDEALVGLDSISELAAATQAFIAAAEAIDSPDPADLAPPEPEPSTVHCPKPSRDAGISKGTSAPKTANYSTRSSTTVSRYLQAKRDGDPSLETMSVPALRAQALADLAANALRREPGSWSRSDRYHVSLVLRLDADGSLHPETRVPAEALCDARFTRIVLGAQSEILDIGHTTRIWPEPMGNAIRLRDQHCRFPHCHRPPGWCDIHHCIHWENGGPTSIDNGILLCCCHHSFLHTKQWQVRLDQHQQPIFTKPDGTTHQPTSCQPRRSA